MSLLGNLMNSLLSTEDSSSQPKPCANCPGSCPIYPGACEECRPYKQKLIDQLYDVEHLEEHYAKYEVVSTAAAPVGNTACPYCCAPNPSGSAVCEYCGSMIGQSSGKIAVTSASEIPDPIQLAQDTIFARQELVRKYAEPESTGLLGSLVSLVSGTQDTFGSRMTTEEVKSTAAAYGVSPASYLSGLDNGTYLTASAKAREEQARQAAEYAVPGAAGMFMGSQMGRQQPTFRSPEPPRSGSRGWNEPPARGGFQSRPSEAAKSRMPAREPQHPGRPEPRSNESKTRTPRQPESRSNIGNSSISRGPSQPSQSASRPAGGNSIKSRRGK